MGVTSSLANTSSPEDVERAPATWGAKFVHLLARFLSAEHRCSLPADVPTPWNPVASEARMTGIYVCPECGLHWHRQI